MHNLEFISDQPGLLVSVRNTAEAQIAVDGGADIIDIKEPSRGPLGAAEADVVAQIVAVVANRKPVSVAVGELTEDHAAIAGLEGVAFAKIGLAGCGNRPDWRVRWRSIIRTWPSSVAPVAVAYADWRAANAPPPEEVLAAALEEGCPALLVDTWDKSSGTLFDQWEKGEVVGFCGRVRAAGLAVVLAGALDGESLLVAIGCGPNLVAVRGAACAGGRFGAITVSKMCAVRNAVSPAGACANYRPQSTVNCMSQDRQNARDSTL